MDKWPWTGEWKCIGCDGSIKDTRWKLWPKSYKGKDLWEFLTNCSVCKTNGMYMQYIPTTLGFSGWKFVKADITKSRK